MLVLVLLFFPCLVLAFFRYYVRPVIRTISQEEIRDFTVHAINMSVTEVMSSSTAFTNLTETIKDEDGNIQLIRANSAAINLLARMVTERAQTNLNTLGEKGIAIPLGSMTGIAFLAGKGPDVRLKAVAAGTVDTSFLSQFLHAGINQTLHKIFINVTATVSIVIPGASTRISSTAQVMVCESIIIGKVPEVYFGDGVSGMVFDLVP